MEKGNFYFLSDDYFIDFPDDKLMKNKETINNVSHDRPCFYAFYAEETKLFWMIPFSSKVDKFKDIYKNKIKKYGKCDTITFGSILGHEKAFLIQNMSPVLPKYIKNEYIDGISNVPVKLDGVFEKELVEKARKVLVLYKKGIPLIFPDVNKIEKVLIQQRQNNKEFEIDLKESTPISLNDRLSSAKDKLKNKVPSDIPHNYEPQK